MERAPFPIPLYTPSAGIVFISAEAVSTIRSICTGYFSAGDKKWRALEKTVNRKSCTNLMWYGVSMFSHRRIYLRVCDADDAQYLYGAFFSGTLL